MIELRVHSVLVSLISNQRVVLLRQQDEERYLPIWIGPFEADSIALELGGASIARPLTHDLLKNIITEFGGDVSHVVINDLSNNTFYARIFIRTNEDTKNIDARPSDAIALAVRTKTKVFASEEVMQRAAITRSPSVGSSAEEKEKPEESEDLGAFSDFLDSLDID